MQIKVHLHWRSLLAKTLVLSRYDITLLTCLGPIGQSTLCRTAQGDQGRGLKAYLHEVPTSYLASVCFKKAEKFCSYKQSNLMQNRPLKSEV